MFPWQNVTCTLQIETTNKSSSELIVDSFASRSLQPKGQLTILRVALNYIRSLPPLTKDRRPKASELWTAQSARQIFSRHAFFTRNRYRACAQVLGHRSRCKRRVRGEQDVCCIQEAPTASMWCGSSESDPVRSADGYQTHGGHLVG